MSLEDAVDSAPVYGVPLGDLEVWHSLFLQEDNSGLFGGRGIDHMYSTDVAEYQGESGYGRGASPQHDQEKIN